MYKIDLKMYNNIIIIYYKNGLFKKNPKRINCNLQRERD